MWISVDELPSPFEIWPWEDSKEAPLTREELSQAISQVEDPSQNIYLEIKEKAAQTLKKHLGEALEEGRLSEMSESLAEMIRDLIRQRLFASSTSTIAEDDPTVMLVETSYQLLLKPYKTSLFWTREQHLSRIAYFVAYGWRDPPQIHMEGPGKISIEDGRHRLAAALYVGHTKIFVKVSGDKNEITRLRKT